MEQSIGQAVGFMSSADLYLLALVGVLTALVPIVRKTKTKTDDKILDKALSILTKVRSLYSKKKVETIVETKTEDK